MPDRELAPCTHSLIDFEKLSLDIQGFSSLGIRPGLERMARLLSRLGSPEKKFPAIQVLGTNGKGSTAATLESICEAAGLKTALYTSPHLVSLRERVRVRKKHADIGIWRCAWGRIKEAVESDRALDALRPTFFENLTALAFLIMSESGIDIAIIEAGMGGRYDATSSCNAAATVVTPIGMDHMEYLGDTLRAIAGEKFAAIRSGVPAFYAADDEPLTRQFAERCESVGSPAFPMSRIAFPENIRCGLDGTSFDYVRETNDAGDLTAPLRLTTPLVGIHQAYNASNAITVLLELRKTMPLFAGIGEDQIRSGLSAVDWPGRMEVFRAGSGSPLVLLDGAHNEHGFRALVKSLSLLVENGQAAGIGAVVFAAMKDKEISGIIALLKGLDTPVFCTQLPMSRARPAAELALILENAGCETRGAHDDPASALAAALEVSAPGELVVCCGSLFLAGAVRKTLTKS
jgi:dihydrofolate synthase/folylpolyglutamate synthase